MKSITSKSRWLAAAVIVVFGLMTRSGALAAPDSPQCGCWFDGYDDGSEYPMEKIREGEHYEDCKKQGNQSPYEQGFTAGHGRKERKCPL